MSQPADGTSIESALLLGYEIAIGTEGSGQMAVNDRVIAALRAMTDAPASVGYSAAATLFAHGLVGSAAWETEVGVLLCAGTTPDPAARRSALIESWINGYATALYERLRRRAAS